MTTPCFARTLQKRIRVRRFTGLGDCNHEGVTVVNAGVIKRDDRRRRQGHGNAGRDFEQVAPESRCIVGSSACGEDDELGPRLGEAGTEGFDTGQLTVESSFERARLLANLFEHFGH